MSMPDILDIPATDLSVRLDIRGWRGDPAVGACIEWLDDGDSSLSLVQCVQIHCAYFQDPHP